MPTSLRTFGTYLWKEWRDHRAVLVGMVVAVPLLLLVMAFALPRTALDDAGLPLPFRGKREDFAAFAALACFALFVVSLATDLVPGEARRGHRPFLERLPGGLNAAFRGKLVLFALGGAFFAAYGYFAAGVACRIVAGAWPALPSLGTATWITAIFALWVFAVSCSLPRGALSLPATAALALLLALPAILLWMLYPSRGPASWWRWESGALWTLGAVAAAWLAFRRRGFLRAGRACLTVGAVCALPYWADAAHDAWKWRRHSIVEISHAFLGEGGSYAFVNRIRGGVGGESPMSPVIVDLRTGAEREIGTKFCRFGSDWSAPYDQPYRLVYLWDVTSHDAVIDFDTRTGERVQPTQEERVAARRARPVWRYSDGRVAWYQGGRLVIGDVEEPNLKNGSGACGLGLQTWTPRGFYDFGRDRFVPVRGLALRGEDVWIRPGAWLTRKGEFRLFDPDANAFAPALGLAPKDEICAILDDGRVLAFRRGEGSLLVVPETGATGRAGLPRGFGDAGRIVQPHGAPMRTPGGRRVFMLYRDGRIEKPPTPYRSACVRQDGDTFVATAAFDGDVTFLGCPTDDEVLVRDDTSIWRLRFGSDAREEIWRAR